MPLVLACWFWLIAIAGTAALAWAGGADVRGVAAMAALAIAPALTGFILSPHVHRRWIAAGFIAVWIVAAAGLVAGTGGASSPLAAMFAVAPALALALGRRWAAEAGAGAVLGYAAGVGASLMDTPPRAALGAYPEMLAVAAIALAAGLMALGQGARGRRVRDGAAGQRIAEVSHELRTPLTHILGFSEMIERQIFGEIGARYVEYAGLIRKSGAHLLGLVNDLLDLSKIEAGRYDLELGEFDVRNVVEEVVRLSTDAADKRQIALGIITPQAPLMVRADDRAIRRMLINTIGNAIKFTPEGGRVMASASVADGALMLETIDNGPGFSAEDRAKLGEAYQTGSARAEGTGLGLSLVRALAALHGGELSFHDAPGGGALVRITLPVLVSAGS
ncbi:MAG: sensor histidine kinase [Hyphomonadaceae bacterium]